MNAFRKFIILVSVLAGIYSVASPRIFGQAPVVSSPRDWGEYAEVRPVAFETGLSDYHHPSRTDAANCLTESGLCCDPQSAFVAGAEFLLIRPHFSEAIAFANGAQTLGTWDTSARALNFGYEGALRTYLGYRLADNSGELRFTYWHANNTTRVDGAVGGPGQFIVDPFGNLAGSVTVINPADPRFLTTLTGGDSIRTQASVRTNVYDLDFIKPFSFEQGSWQFEWSAGVRLADINQFYESAITNAGNPFSTGSFTADFLGAGPRLGLQVEHHFGSQSCFSVFANTHGSLLLGDHQVEFNNTDAATGFAMSQAETMTRTIPVLETELGTTTRLWNRFDLSLGWMFQAWYDLGTSGGTFGGFFTGADDSNVMSFDGLFVRGQFEY